MKVNWIKCSDRLPKENRNIILVYGKKYENDPFHTFLATYSKDFLRREIQAKWKAYHDDKEVFKVSHWTKIELPTTPPEEQE